ncbi:hypothetical protein NEF87_003720 [Candidatus Lokiarchaeum ossiferum]|uniref:GAF domain-containing protein n=1 Tax=Candidatus Lokiarchaeum ossiferum TaxID=2951803 RepID=A0ABY6HVJ5_9ARCH|nr:hypothetical protein NEF87_003720 [Candidatus Lokiarchaeum sp. B-35]
MGFLCDDNNALGETKTTRMIYLELKNSCNLEHSLSLVLKYLQQLTTIEAISIRLHEDGDFPYFVYNGFTKEFIQHEMYLCVKDFSGKRVKEHDKNQLLLECMCGNVIRGRTNPEFPFFSKGGSFWANHTTELLANTTEADRQASTRNYCNRCGFESVALIPIRNEGNTLGLIQLNDHRIGMFDLDQIEFLEMIGDIIGSKIIRDKEFHPPNFKEFNDLIVTVCSFCRSAKVSDMEWVSIEKFFTTVEKIDKIYFSHGVCPNCLPLLDPEYQGSMEKKNHK